MNRKGGAETGRAAIQQLRGVSAAGWCQVCGNLNSPLRKPEQHGGTIE
jgi:hypothetical protein